MLGRHQQKLVDKYGIDYILKDLAPITKDRKLVSNLECPMIDIEPNKENDTLAKFSCNQEIAPILKDNGFVALSLGNNHIFDFGEQGFISTKLNLKKNSIEYFGAGENSLEALKPSIINISGRKLGFHSFSFTRKATRSSAGVAYLYDKSIFSTINKTKQKVDFLIIMPHSGIELFEYPLDRDRNIYKKMIESGADIVVGSQPHCVQAHEYHNNKNIYYSTGDLLFDHFHNETWKDFNSEVSHVKKYSLSPNRNLPFYSLAILIDIKDDRLVVNHEPIFNKDGYNPRLLNKKEKIKWNMMFDRLNKDLIESPEVEKQRKEIEKKLLKDLKKRAII